MDTRALSLVLLGLASACTSTSAAPAPDDAAIPELDGAPSSVDTGSPDAPAPDATVADDAGIDAADAGSAPVTLRAIDVSGVAEPGVTVFFSDATGSLLASDTTGAAGTVSEVVPAGSQVTAVFGTATSPALLTIVAVEPGDELTAVDTVSAAATFSESVTVLTYPASPPDGGVDFSINAGRCATGGPSAPVTFSLFRENQCEVGGVFPLLAIEQDDSNAEIAFAFQKSIPVAGDGGLDDAGAQDVSMAADPWAPVGSFAFAASNAPSGVNLVLSEVAGYVPFSGSEFVTPDDAGTAHATVPLHPGYADFFQTEASFAPQPGVLPDGGPSGQPLRSIVIRSATAAATASLDVSLALPLLTSAVVDDTDAARPSVGWSSVAPLSSLDGLVALVSWSGGPGSGSWTFIVPPAATMAHAPALPPAASAWAPTSADVFASPVVVGFEATFWSDYAAFRADTTAIAANPAGTIVNCAYPVAVGIDDAPPCLPPLPADGTLRMTAYAPASSF